MSAQITPNTYTSGDLVRCSAAFTDAAGAPVNPTTVTGFTKTPAGIISPQSVTHDSLGNYHFDVSVSESGTWYYRLVGTGAAQAAAEGRFIVAESAF